MKHELKILENYAKRILSGQKDFEVRLNDRDYQKGDILVFTVIESDSGLRHPRYLKFEMKIKYIHTGLGMIDGYVILGLKEVE